MHSNDNIKMVSGRTFLKIYCLCLGFTTSFLAFLWTLFQFYLLYTTASTQHDLMVARYLDISFGLLGLSSSLSLLYGAFVESKTWLTVWTLGSTTLIIGRWAWFFYQKYWVEHPESLKEAQQIGVILSVIYIVLIIPVLINYKYLESNHLSFSEWIHDISKGKMCRIILGPFCLLFSSNYYNNVGQTVCANDGNVTRNVSRTTNRDAFDYRDEYREDNNVVLYWNVRKGDSKSEKHEKYNVQGGGSYRYMVTPNGFRVVLPTGNKNSIKLTLLVRFKHYIPKIVIFILGSFKIYIYFSVDEDLYNPV